MRQGSSATQLPMVLLQMRTLAATMALQPPPLPVARVVWMPTLPS